jgi:D-xylonolactonase
MQDKVELIVDDNNLCGESPVWDAARSRLLWADVSSAKIFEFRPEISERRLIGDGINVSAIALNHDGRLLVASPAGLILWSEAGEHAEVVQQHDGQPLSFNDMTTGPDGSIYGGTMFWDPHGMQRTGCLYHVRTNRTVRVLDDGIELSNGLAFSPDDSTLYYADTAARRIYAYDVNPSDGSLRRKRAFAIIAAEDGLPDGLTVDADGNVWCAMWYGSQVIQFDPDGTIKRRVRTPAKQTSSVAFGGNDLDVLYVTSAGESWMSDLMPPGYDPAGGTIGGALYRVRLDARGRSRYLSRFA